MAFKNIFKYNRVILNCNNISQYCHIFTIFFEQINPALLSIRYFQKHIFFVNVQTPKLKGCVCVCGVKKITFLFRGLFTFVIYI